MAIDAMYVEIGSHGDYMFVHVDTETPFTAEFPTGQVFRENGEKLSREQISTGDVFRIYGDGAMTMSLPAQYPGVTRMVRIKYGSPEDAEQYNEILNNLKQILFILRKRGLSLLNKNKKIRFEKIEIPAFFLQRKRGFLIRSF